ncbi:hypothetical protein D910_05702 [Dendroctonus ponderosae]
MTHNQAPLEFAREHVNWDLDDWKKDLFTDVVRKTRRKIQPGMYGSLTGFPWWLNNVLWWYFFGGPVLYTFLLCVHKVVKHPENSWDKFETFIEI